MLVHHIVTTIKLIIQNVMSFSIRHIIACTCVFCSVHMCIATFCSSIQMISVDGKRWIKLNKDQFIIFMYRGLDTHITYAHISRKKERWKESGTETNVLAHAWFHFPHHRCWMLDFEIMMNFKITTKQEKWRKSERVKGDTRMHRDTHRGWETRTKMIS